MHASPALSRRAFLGTLATAAAATQLPLKGLAAEAAPSTAANRWPLITFTKPFQMVSYEQCADIVAEVGWSGIECPVRAKGQVLPEKVEDDLPRLQEALKKRNLTLTLLTTDIKGVDPLAEKVLRTAAKLGVKKYRLTFMHYDLKKAIPPQIAEWKAQLKDLAALNKELGLCGALQNHSGKDYIGAPIWDIYEIVHDLDPAHLGTCFDIGHATLEGGLSWPIEAKLMEPFFTCVYVKDFHWEKKGEKWQSIWGPLGDGMVNKQFFTWLKGSSYQGPISQHCEYLTGAGPEQMAAMKKDIALLKKWLAEA